MKSQVKSRRLGHNWQCLTAPHKTSCSALNPVQKLQLSKCLRSAGVVATCSKPQNDHYICHKCHPEKKHTLYQIQHGLPTITRLPSHRKPHLLLLHYYCTATDLQGKRLVSRWLALNLENSSNHNIAISSGKGTRHRQHRNSIAVDSI